MASFAIPRRAPVLVLAEPDFSKIDDSKLVSIEVNRDIYTITPLVETWESLEPVV